MTAWGFWFALALLAHTFVGYPLLMAIWARWAPRPVRRAPIGATAPRVAVVVVAYNEAARIEHKLATLLAQDYPAERLRIVVAVDGASDETARIVARYADRRVTLLPFATRRGKAACLNDAVAACDEEIIVFNDARQALNREAVRMLVENFGDARIGAVSGELVFVADDMSPFAGGVDAYWRYEKFIRQQEARTHSVPGATGALYALRRSAFRPIPAGTILDDVAIPMQVVFAGLRVGFDGRAQAFDKASQAPAQERLRKVRTLAGNYQLIAQMPRLLLPWANPIFFQFVSHKVLRLVAPFALVALAATNLALAPGSAFFAATLAAQAAFYLLAAGALAMPALARFKPARLASAFVLLNWFAVLGLLQFVFNRRAHLWAPSAAPRHE